MQKRCVHLLLGVFLRLLSVFAVYFVCRILFFAFNKSLFSEVGLVQFFQYCFWGLRFDLVAILYINALFIVLSFLPFRFRTNKGYQSVLFWIFILSNSIGIVFNAIDFGYYPFILQRATANIFDFFSTEGGGMFHLIFSLAGQFWFVPISVGVLIYLFYKINRLVVVKTDLDIKNDFLFFGVNLIVLLLVLGVAIVGIRGGIRRSVRPINMSNAAKYTDNPAHTALILNTPFCIIRTIKHEDADRLNYFSERELDNTYPLRKYYSNVEKFKPKNVVLIILESFGKEYSGYLNPQLENGTYKGYTPFLDSLMKQSKVYVNTFANGRKSIDAIPSLVAGIPSLGNPYITSHHSNNRVESLPLLLKEKGYSAVFFHGAPIGSMGFDAFCKVAGYDKYFGQEDFEKEQVYVGDVWGVFDEEFLKFFAKGLNKEKEPFLATVFTLSSHSPFVVPEKYENKFPKGTLDIHRSIGYSDYSLKQFFEQIKKEPWYKNTVFVISPDHCSVPYYPEYKTNSGFFSIPLIIYDPASDLNGIDSTYAQQIDVLPTILDYLDFEKPFNAFGNSLLDTSALHFSVNYLNGNYQIIKDGYLLIFDLKKPIAFYNIQSDRMLKKNILGGNPKKEEEMLILLKAFIQQYNNRLLDNKFAE